MPIAIDEKPRRARTYVRREPAIPPVVRRLMNIGLCAEALGLSPWTIRRWVIIGKLSSVKLGGRVMIPVSELDRIVAEGTRRRA